MALAAGARLGRYEIRSLIGAGGMGEVYLAVDTHLERPVALKILPEDVAADEKRMNRFFQEAKAASALNHPNIVTVHEIGREGNVHYFSTEYVDGETLRHRLRNAPLKYSEVIDLASQVASALVAAHAAGIVHRDIKPENIMIRKDGYVKILDFGLAKLTESRKATIDSEAATKALVNTEPGAVMGTVAYMSPEQALGNDVDARSDVWSLGVVIYEMLTGQTPFQGSTPSHIMVAITDKEPAPLRQYVPEVPEALEWIVFDALTKDREERTQNARELLSKLRRLKQRLTPASEPEQEVAPDPSFGTTYRGDSSTPSYDVTLATSNVSTAELGEALTAPTISSAEFISQKIRSHKTAASIWVLLGVVLLGVLIFAGYKFVGRTGPSRLPQPAFTRLTSGGKVGNAAITGGASISPDGKYVAFLTVESGQSSIWVEQVLTGSVYQVLPPVQGADYGPTAFSRDGEFIFYTQIDEKNPSGVLYQLPVLGGTARRILSNLVSTANFSPDGKRFAFIRRNVEKGESLLVTANADGTDELTVAMVKNPDSFPDEGPSWSPDGRRIAVGINHGIAKSSSVSEFPAEGGPETPIGSQSWPRVFRVVWLADGSGLLVTGFTETTSTGTQLWFLSYPSGEARRITNDLGGYGTVSLGVTADSNTLVTVQEDWSSQIWRVPIREDASHARRLTTGKYDGIGGLDISPDGKILYPTKTGQNVDLWTMNSDGSGKKQLTADVYIDEDAVFSRDGRNIFFASDRSGNLNIWKMDSDGNNLQQLTDGTGPDIRPALIDNDQWVIFDSGRSGGRTLWKVPSQGGSAIQFTDYFSRAPVFSPDGKWVACYAAMEANKPSRLALITPQGGQPVKTFEIAPGGPGYELRWTPDGSSLVYAASTLSQSAIWSQPISGAKPVQLFTVNDNLINSFVFERNGKDLIVSYGPQTDDIVLIRDFR